MISESNINVASGLTPQQLTDFNYKVSEIWRLVNDNQIPYSFGIQLLDWIIGGCKGMPPVRPFSIWKTIKVEGDFGDKSQVREMIKSSGCKMDDTAQKIFNLGSHIFAFENYRAGFNIPLVLVSVAELGFPNGANWKMIYDRAKELGLSFCPWVTIPVLCLQYIDQPIDGKLMIAIGPIRSPGGYLYTFSIQHTPDGLYLMGSNYYAPAVFGAKSLFVFSLPEPVLEKSVVQEVGPDDEPF